MPAPSPALGLISLFNGYGLEHMLDPESATPELFDQLLSLLLHPRTETQDI